MKGLGVTIDENLTWEKHIAKICKKASAGIGAIKRAKPYVDINTLQTIYKALVQPYFDYCSTLWGNCGKSLQDKLQKFQSRAARVITGASYDVRSTDILTTLSWETLDNRRKKSKAVFMYKVLTDHAAPGLKEYFHVRNVTQNTYNLRNSDYDLTIPKSRTEYLRRSFKYSGAMLWNDLSFAAKSASTQKRDLKRFKLGKEEDSGPCALTFVNSIFKFVIFFNVMTNVLYFCIVCGTPLVKISSVLTRLACLNKVFTYLPTYLVRALSNIKRLASTPRFTSDKALLLVL